MDNLCVVACPFFNTGCPTEHDSKLWHSFVAFIWSTGPTTRQILSLYNVQIDYRLHVLFYQFFVIKWYKAWFIISNVHIFPPFSICTSTAQVLFFLLPFSRPFMALLLKKCLQVAVFSSLWRVWIFFSRSSLETHFILLKGMVKMSYLM